MQRETTFFSKYKMWLVGGLRLNGITTNFVPKGKQKTAHIEQASIMRKLLNVESDTRLEGSFGNEKNLYLLQKNKCKIKTH